VIRQERLGRWTASFHGVFENQLEPRVSEMTTTIEEANKALVLEAFDTLFNQRDYKAAGGFGR
jgi:hypothetical protein